MKVALKRLTLCLLLLIGHNSNAMKCPKLLEIISDKVTGSLDHIQPNDISNNGVQIHRDAQQITPSNGQASQTQSTSLGALEGEVLPSGIGGLPAESINIENLLISIKTILDQTGGDPVEVAKHIGEHSSAITRYLRSKKREELTSMHKKTISAFPEAMTYLWPLFFDEMSLMRAHQAYEIEHYIADVLQDFDSLNLWNLPRDLAIATHVRRRVDGSTPKENRELLNTFLYTSLQNHVMHNGYIEKELVEQFIELNYTWSSDNTTFLNISVLRIVMNKENRSDYDDLIINLFDTFMGTSQGTTDDHMNKVRRGEKKLSQADFNLIQEVVQYVDDLESDLLTMKVRNNIKRWKDVAGYYNP